MLRSLKQIRKFSVQASNEDNIGKVEDVYLGDESWVLRYIVVRAGNWLDSKEVLLSPYGISGIGWAEGKIWTNLTSAEIIESPMADTSKPISRRFEEQYSQHFNWPYYWAEASGLLWPGIAYPFGQIDPIERRRASSKSDLPATQAEDFEESIRETHLRSLNELLGYKIHSKDAELFGKVEDFIFEEETWAIRFLIIDTKASWLGAKKVLVSPTRIHRVLWDLREIYIDLERSAIERCPVYDPDKPIQDLLEQGHFIEIGRSVSLPSKGV